MLALAVFGIYAGVARADGSAATLSSDHATYSPGDTAQLSGGNWLPGEPVHIHVADTGGHSWSFDDDVSAAADGSMSDSVLLPADFSSGFSAIATSGFGPSATTSFSSSSAPMSQPTIVTDQNDYPPGSTVTLTGAGWQAGELVQIFADDSDGHTWNYSADVSADANGNFTTQFQISSSFVANYSVTATGFSSGTATTSFTDATSVTNVSFSGATQAANVTTTWTASFTTSATGALSVPGSITITFDNSFGVPTSPSVSVTGLGGAHCQAGTATRTAQSNMFVVTVPLINQGGTCNLPGSSDVSVAVANVTNPGAGSYVANRFSVATTADTKATNSPDNIIITACSTPAVGTQPTAQSVTYGANASFIAAATGSPSPTVQWQESTNGGSTWTSISNGGIYGGATTGTLTLTKPPVSGPAKQYRAVFTNTCGTATSNAATLTVNPKNLTVTGITASNKVYDGNATATMNTSSAALSGVVSGDTVNLNNGSASGVFLTKTVGTGKTVQISGLTISGTDAGNYSLTQPTTTADITAKPLTVSFAATNKVYDGNAGATIKASPVPSLVGVVSGDTVNLNGGSATATFGSKAVGTGKTVTASGFTISGTDAGNYAFATPQGTTTADITAKNLTITGAVAHNKVYDGNTNATVDFSGASPNGVAGSDSVTIDSSHYAASFGTATVGTSKTVTVTGVALSGSDASNYTVSQPSGLSADITRKNLTISGASANDRIYNGGINATVDFSGASLNGVVGTDNVSIDSSGSSASFADKMVGTSKAVTVNGVALTGTDASNYTVSQPSGLTANITAKQLSVSFAADNKVYDGNASASIKSSPAPSLVGVVSGDTVTLDGSSATASFGSKAVGTGKTVTAGGFTKSGSDAGNYVFASPQGTTTGDITAKNLTISGAVAHNKAYNGNTDASVDFSGASLNGVVGGDAVSINSSGYSASFATASVGTGKSVTVSGVTLSGSDASNYTVSQPSGLTADITAKGLTISGAAANNKQYDSTDAATIDWTHAVLNGVVGSDDVSIDHSGYSAHLNNKNAGSGKAVTVSGVTLGGADAGNYSVSQPSGLTASVSKAPLDISAAGDSKTYDGNTSSSGVPTVSGLQGSDDTVTGLTQAFASKNVLGAGNSVLTVTGYTVDDGNSGANYDVTTHNASGTITAKGLTISGAAANNKQYDGNDSATIDWTQAVLNGVVGSDSVSINHSSSAAHFDNTSVGTAKDVTVTGVSLGGGDAGNYTVSQPSGLKADITAKNLTISGAAANDKVYNGTDTAAIEWTHAVLNGVVGTDDVAIDHSSYQAHFDSRNVGSNKDVTVTGVTLSGADAGNYTVSQPSGLKASITAKGLTISGAVAQNKVYDRTTDASVDFGGASLNGVVNGDNVTIDHNGYSASFDTHDVGSGKAVTVSDVGLSGSDAGNYTVSQPSGLTANITAKPLSGSFTADDKVYDGNRAATVTNTSLPGVISGDTVNLDVSNALFDTKNVGTGKNVIGDLGLSGADAGNYSVNAHYTTTAAVTAKSISVYFEGQNKTYDGGDLATIKITPAPHLVGVVSGDTVTLDGTNAVAHFDNKNVGTGKTVTTSGFTKSGADAGNYAFATPQGTATADISAAQLSVSFSAENKTYDGSNSATIKSSPAPGLVGVIGSDDVSIGTGGASATFGNKNAGTGKTVTASGFTKSGADAGNYVFADPQGTTTANITQLGITGSFTTHDKVYDGNAGAAIDSESLRGVIGSDDVSLTGGAATFDNKNVGTNKTVALTGAFLTGGDAGNYSVTSIDNSQANITQLGITGSFTAANKVYDGGTSASVTNRSLNGVVSGDNVNLNGGTATFADKNVGTGKAVSLSGATLTGIDAGNYNLTSVGNAHADITALGITGSFSASSKVYDGNASATVTDRSLNGSASGDDVSLTGGTASFGNKNVGTGKTVTLTGASLSGNDAGNYSLTSVNDAHADITARAITVTAHVDTKVYDGTTSSSPAPDVTSGLVISGDTPTFNQAFANKQVATGKTIIPAGFVADGNSGNNYAVTFVNNTNGVITARPITVTARPDSKTYDGTTSSSPTPTVTSGSIAPGDTANFGQAFGNMNVGTGKTITPSGSVADGNSGNNYAVTFANDTTGVISARPITVTARTDTRVYDGTTGSSPTPDTTSGTIANGDTANFGQAYATKTVGTGKTIIPSGSVADGNNGNNYAVTFVNNTTGVITPKALTVSGITASSKPYDGNTAATLNVSAAALVGVVPNDTVTLSTAGATGTFASSAVGSWTVTISGLTISGADAGNYSLTQPSTTASIGAWFATGFYSPVGVGNSLFIAGPHNGNPPFINIWNTAKSGSTIPLKFNLYRSQGGTELTDTADVASFTLLNVSCDNSSTDSVDFTTTGNTSLRYDSTAMQFIQNWKTPAMAGCYRTKVLFIDGSAIYAWFKLK